MQQTAGHSLAQTEMRLVFVHRNAKETGLLVGWSAQMQTVGLAELYLDVTGVHWFVLTFAVLWRRLSEKETSLASSVALPLVMV